MINGADRTKHGNAALCLTDIPQAEALRPLLPWLTDASWSPIGGDAARRRLLWSLAKVKLPEAMPGLIEMLHHSDPWLVEEAAKALAYQEAKEAGPALREALNRAEGSHLFDLARAAVRVGAFTDTELVQYIELTARRAAVDEQPPAFDHAPDSSLSDAEKIPLLIGREVVNGDPPPGREIVNVALKRADELERNEPDLADRMRTVIAAWGDPAAVTAIVQRLRSGDFTGRWLAKVVEPVDPLFSSLAPQESVGATERHLAITAAVAGIDGLHGLARGVQCAMTGIGVEDVLRGNDRSATLALLASARITRTRLPLSAVALLLDSADPLQIRAAEQYLIS